MEPRHSRAGRGRAHPESVLLGGVRPHDVGRDLRGAEARGVLAALSRPSQIGERPELHRRNWRRQRGGTRILGQGAMGGNWERR